MRILIPAVILIIIACCIAKLTGIFDTRSLGDKVAGRTILPDQKSLGLADEQRRVAASVSAVPPPSDKAPKVTMFYRFVNRTAPAGVGTIDAPSNSVTKEVEKGDERTTSDLWHALDVPIVRRRLRLQVIEFSSPEESGFSLPALVSAVSAALTGQVSSFGSGSLATAANGIAVPVLTSTEAIGLVNSFLSQVHPKTTAHLKISTYLWLTNGEKQTFSDFSEQASANTVVTQVQATTSEDRRQVGLTVEFNPVFGDRFSDVAYSISSTQPDTPLTVTGDTVAGNFSLPLDGSLITLLDSERLDSVRETDRFLGVPVGFLKTLVARQDLILVQSVPDVPEGNVALPAAIPVFRVPPPKVRGYK